MPIFDTLSYAEPENMYMGKPVQEVKALNKQLSEDYINNYNEIDKLDILAKNLDVNEVDYEAKLDFIDNVKKQFKNFADKGDYENATLAVAKAKKEFETNQLLNGVKKSRELTINYYKDLNKKKEEGKLREDDYNYALQVTKLNNTKPVEIDETTGQVKNLFSGVEVLEDQTKEIYKDTFDTIKDWKEGSEVYGVDRNGQERTFKLDKVTGITYDLITGKKVEYSEVYNALKTKIETSYKDFLNQEKQVENFNKFFIKEKGEYRQVEREHIPLNDEAVFNLVTGYSFKDIEMLQKLSKNNVARKAEYEEALKRKNNFSLNSQETLNKAYAAYQDRETINKYITPATDKASYTIEQHNDFVNESEKLALQHSYDKKKIDYENNLNAFPTSLTEIQETSVEQLQDAHKESKRLNDKVFSKQQEYNKIKDNPNISDTYKKNILKEIEDAKIELDIHNTSQNQVFETYANSNPEVAKEILSYGFADLLKAYDKNPGKYGTNVGFILNKIKQEYSKVSKEDEKRQLYEVGLSGGTEKDINNIKNRAFYIVQQYSNDLLNAINANSVNKELFNIATKNIGKYNNLPAKLVDIMNETKEKDPNLKSQYTEKVIGIDPNSDKAIERAAIDRLTNVVKNAGGSFMFGDKSLDEFQTGNSGIDFYSTNDKGELVKAKTIKVGTINPVYGNPDGKSRVSVTFVDEKGNPVYKGGDKKSLARFSFIGSDQASLNDYYLNFGSKLVESEDGAARLQGLDIISNTKFSPFLKNIRLSGMNQNAEKISKIPTSQGEMTIKIIKRSDGNTENEVFDVFRKNEDTKQYEPFVLSTSNNSKTYTFNNLRSFRIGLAQNGY
jgi:hypothetical protein